jgi:hypothetical protein
MLGSRQIPASSPALLSTAAEPFCTGKCRLIAVVAGEGLAKGALAGWRAQAVMPRLRIFSNRGWT